MSDIVYTKGAVDASFVKFDGTNLVQAGVPIPNANASTIALDTDGTPFYSPVGTSAVALDTDGNPYVTGAAVYLTADSAAATYTTLATAQTITAQHSFQNGLKVGSMVMQPYPNDPTGTVMAQFGLFAVGPITIYNDSPSGRATRIPFGLTLDINGATLDPGGKGADKVGSQLNVNFHGDFTNETTIGATDAPFLWGADDFITSGSAANDLKGITDFWGRETEIHLASPGAALNTFKALHTETAIESTAVGTHVGIAIGHHITNQVINGSPAGTTVDTWHGLLIDPPTQATDNYAIFTGGQTKSRFGGDILMNADPSQPHSLNAYYGSLIGKTVQIGQPTDLTSAARLNVKTVADSDVGAWIAGRGAQSGDLTRWGLDTTVITRIDSSGRLVLNNPIARGEVPDAGLSNGELSFSVDATTGAMKLNIKGKDNGGTIRRATIALA